MFVTQLFPTEFWQFNSTDIDNEKLLSIILEEEQNQKSVSYSNVGGWHSDDISFQDKRYNEVGMFIRKSFETVYKANNYIDNLLIKVPAMWSMVNRKTHFNKHHFHPDCDWSFTYYVSAPVDSGNIVLVDPRIRKAMRDHRFILKNYKNPGTHEIFALTPIAGQLIIFPSYVEHHVEQNLTDNVRVCIAANIALEKKT